MFLYTTIVSALTDFYLHRLPDFKGKWAILRLFGPVLDGTPVRSRYNASRLLIETQDRTNRLGILGTYGRTVADIVESLRPGECFIDVGANCGLFTIMASRQVGAEGLVIAFEPCPTTYVKLVRNIALNGLTNVLPLNLAVGPAPGIARLDTSATGHSGRFSVAVEQVASSTQIFMADFDSLSALTAFVGDRPTIVKIDVEGFEQAALQGLCSVVARPATRQVVVEVDRHNLVRYGASPESLHALMRDLGFTPTGGEIRDEHYDEVYVRRAPAAFPASHESAPQSSTLDAELVLPAWERA